MSAIIIGGLTFIVKSPQICLVFQFTYIVHVFLMIFPCLLFFMGLNNQQEKGCQAGLQLSV